MGFWLYNEPALLKDDYQIIRIDKKGTTLARFFPRNTLSNHSYNFASSNVFQKNGINLYFSPRYDNVIYEMDNDEWRAEFQYSFNDKTYSNNMNISDEDIEDHNFIFRRNFYILDDYVINDYLISNFRYFSFYNRHTHQIISGSIKNDIIPDYDRFFPQWSNGNLLIESIDTKYVIEDFPELMKTNALKNLCTDDNPVLIFYTFSKNS
jgi:hypothetical protein